MLQTGGWLGDYFGRGSLITIMILIIIDLLLTAVVKLH
jgi:hypothetical protein